MRSKQNDSQIIDLNLSFHDPHENHEVVDNQQSEQWGFSSHLLYGEISYHQCREHIRRLTVA